MRTDPGALLTPLLTPAEVAEKLKIDVRTVHVLLRTRVLPHLDLGYRTKRIRPEDLEAYLVERAAHAHA